MPPQPSQPQPSDTSSQPVGEPERTEVGQQHVIPGTERISDAELAKRRAEQPLKPKATQKPADEGLFSDESKQTDLIDQLTAKGRAGDLKGRSRAGRPSRS
jgi:hypothetical protein